MTPENNSSRHGSVCGHLGRYLFIVNSSPFEPERNVCNHRKKRFRRNGRLKMGCLDDNGQFIVDAEGQVIKASDCASRNPNQRRARMSRLMSCQRCRAVHHPHLRDRDPDGAKDIAIVLFIYAWTGIRPPWNRSRYH